MTQTLIDDDFAVSLAPAVVVPPKQDPPPVADDVPAFRREIDLGDGSGKQVFEGGTAEELIDKLADAQKHATAKIREQNRQLKLAPKPAQEKKTARAKYEPKKLSVDDEFMLGQQLTESPRKAVAAFLEADLGMSLEQVREKFAKLDEFEQERRETATAVKFVEAHPDYAVTPKNYNTIREYLDNNELAFTKSNLDHAFEELSTSGLLDKPQPTVAAPSDPVAEARIEPIAPVAPKKPANTGLSDRSSRPASAAASQGVLTAVEIENMTAAEYNAYFNAQMAAQGLS